MWFFGAGCARNEVAPVMLDLLSNYYENAKIEIDSDLKGAIIAGLTYRAGIGIILGTGSNIAIIDENSKIIESRSGNGNIFGDEGSGTHLDKL